MATGYEVMAFIESISAYQAAQGRLSAAISAYSGYSPDWALSNQIREADRAAKNLEEDFRKAVLAVMEAK